MNESGQKPRKKHWGAAFKAAAIYTAIFCLLSFVIALSDLEGGLRMLKKYPPVIVMVGIIIVLIVIAKFIHVLYRGPSKRKRF